MSPAPSQQQQPEALSVAESMPAPAALTPVQLKNLDARVSALFLEYIMTHHAEEVILLIRLAGTVPGMACVTWRAVAVYMILCDAARCMSCAVLPDRLYRLSSVCDALFSALFGAGVLLHVLQHLPLTAS